MKETVYNLDSTAPESTERMLNGDLFHFPHGCLPTPVSSPFFKGETTTSNRAFKAMLPTFSKLKSTDGGSLGGIVQKVGKHQCKTTVTSR